MTKDRDNIKDFEERHFEVFYENYIEECSMYEPAMNLMIYDLKKTIERARKGGVPNDIIRDKVFETFQKHGLATVPRRKPTDYPELLADCGYLNYAQIKLKELEARYLMTIDEFPDEREAPTPLNLDVARDKATDRSET